MRYILLFVLVGLFSRNNYAVNYTANAGLGTWSVPTNWTPVGVPGAGDNVTIPDGATMRIIFASESCASLTIDAGVNFTTSNAQLLMAGASLNVSGNVTITGDIFGIGLAKLIIATTSSVTVGGGVNFTSYGAGACAITMNSGASFLNIAGNFTDVSFSSSPADALLDPGVGSTVNFNGTTAQTIPVSFPNFVFNKIKTNNSHASGATPDAAYSATKLKDSLIIASGNYNDGGFNHVIVGNISNAGTYNASGNIDLTGNFTNSGTFTSAGCNINIEGDWTNSGLYQPVAPDNVIFDGTGASAATITGATSWYELTCNHATGVTVSSGAQSIIGILNIDQGTFTSGGLVTLLSNASGTAQMDNIGTGSYSGNLTVQRFFTKTAQGFSTLASPVTGTSLNSWSSSPAIGNDSIIFSGFPGSDYPAFSFLNTFTYNEPSHGSLKANGWAPAGGMSDLVGPSNSFKAAYVYMDAVSYRIIATGTPTTGNTSIPLDFTSSGNPPEDGWNLIGNPYPCTIDWMTINNSISANVIDAYSVYAADLGNFAVWDGSGLGVGTNGATQFIPSTQGFWIQVSATSNLAIAESDKNALQDPGFIKSSTTDEFFRIELTGDVNQFRDEALIIAGDSYVNNFENSDLVKLISPDSAQAPSLFSYSTDNVKLAFNKINNDGSISIPLTAKAGTLAQGLYTMDFDIPSTYIQGACITLEDLHTGTITDLRVDTSYSYTTSDTTTLPRFIIHIVKDYSVNITDLTCYGTNDGLVDVTGNGITGSMFNLLDGSGNVVASSVSVNDAVSFGNIPGGTYEISSNFNGSCGSNVTGFAVVDEPMQVTANFNLMQDTLYLNQNSILEVTNNSLGTNFAWNFGDGNTSTAVNPTNTYISPGVYPVMLTSDNNNVGQCSEVTTKNIVVMSSPLSIEEVLNDNSTKVYTRKGYIVVEFDLENETELEITLIDISGKKITNTLEYISSGRIDLISTDVLSKGIYIVNIIGNNQIISKKLIID